MAARCYYLGAFGVGGAPGFPGRQSAGEGAGKGVCRVGTGRVN